MFIDTHCHLDFKDFDADRDEVINRARGAGVGGMISVGSSLEGSRRCVQLAQRYDCIVASVGVHPHDAQTVDILCLKELEELASRDKVVAIGEVGLDYYRTLSPRDTQKKIFRNFLSLAQKLDLPLILHDRDAHEDMLAILREEFPGKGVRGVMHCFSGDETLLRQCLDLGLNVSFTTNLTFKNAQRLRDLAKQVPIEKLLLETDAPFLAPQAHRGARNEPAYVTYLAEELSRLYGLSAEDVGRVTTHNANALFKLGIAEPQSIAYRIRNSLYLNITNRCTNECSFCVRTFSDFVKGHNLKLAHEPSAAEVCEAMNGIEGYDEIVFCGYGEPTLRLDVVKEIARYVKDKGAKTRLVTNGHGNLIHKRPIAPELVGLVDTVSVSLNVDTADKYNAVCRPAFGKDTFEEIQRFMRDCKASGIAVEMTCLDIPEADIERCRSIAERALGVDFRVRAHNVVG